jgi:hypothetical protein
MFGNEGWLMLSSDAENAFALVVLESKSVSEPSVQSFEDRLDYHGF